MASEVTTDHIRAQVRMLKARLSGLRQTQAADRAVAVLELREELAATQGHAKARRTALETEGVLLRQAEADMRAILGEAARVR